MFSCNFTAYFQNTFLYEHLWRAASEASNTCKLVAIKSVSKRVISEQGGIKQLWDFISVENQFGVQSALSLCSHDLRQNETQTGMDFKLVALTEMKFQTGMRFSCEQNLPAAKWINRLVGYCV